MHIGVDLDNTILDATSTHLHYYNKASGLSFIPEDVNDFYLYRLYGWDEKELNTIYTTYRHYIHWNSTPLPSYLVSINKEHYLNRLDPWLIPDQASRDASYHSKMP